MKNVLITGANSFIGRNFIKFSINKYVDEISLIDNKAENIDFSKYDVVLHLAAIVHQSKKISDNEYYSVNRDLCVEVAEAARKGGVKQFVFLSTLKVYGNNASEREKRNEESDCDPDDPYGRSKLEAEIGLKQLETEFFTVSIIRPALVYGEGVKANMLSIINLVKRVPILPMKNISNRRNFTYIENLVAYIDRIIELKASGIFIAIDDDAISTSQLVKFISQSLGRKIFLFKTPNIIIKTGIKVYPEVFERLFGSLQVDNSKTLKYLDFIPPYSTEQGIQRMISSLKQ
jgi:UDP-glucose 4-epimerase